MSDEQTTWIHCLPWLLEVGVDRAITAREACFCPVDGSHDHLVSTEVAYRALENYDTNWNDVRRITWSDADADTDC